ncbi:O-antigen ligase family protein [Arenimonas sp.]|uniref:O-antigen ligase family protein n=1 Tax=Arenimonas sp. TaxID=1872635 RepID=UPI0039E5AE80
MTPSSPPDWPSRGVAAWLLLVVATWPWPGVSESLLGLGALFVLLAMLWRRYRDVLPLASREAWALCTALFLAYWLPEFFSAFDAVDRAASWREVWLDLRYLPFLLAIAIAMDTARGRRWMLTGLAGIVLFWTMDALLQVATGWSLGGAATADRLSGIFGAGNLKLGLALACLSPFALHWAGKRNTAAWLLVAVALGAAILLAGARAAWLSYGLVLLCSGHRRFGLAKTLAGGVLGLVLLVGGGLFVSDTLATRFQRSAELLQGDEAGVDEALSGRLSIWKAAVGMARAHPLNGIGVRGFRDAYADYAGERDFFLSRGEGPALHAHQLLLEVFSETGVVGLLFWCAGVWIAWVAWHWVGEAARRRSRVPALALAVAAFPLNTHLAFYSSAWGGAFLLLAGLYAGSLMARSEDEPGSA